MSKIGRKIGFGNGTDKKDHKYYKRIPDIKNKKYIYFYSEAEYRAYMNSSINKQNNQRQLDKVTNTKGLNGQSTNQNTSNRRSLSNIMAKTVGLFKSELKTTLSSAFNHAKNIISSNASESVSKALKMSSKLLETSKQKVAELISSISGNKNSNQSSNRVGLLSDLPKYGTDASEELDDPFASSQRRSADMKAVNPNYGTSIDDNGDGEMDYNTNCAYSAVAYEMRRRGYDVEADSSADGEYAKTFLEDPIGTIKSYFPDAEIKDIWNNVVGDTPNDDSYRISEGTDPVTMYEDAKNNIVRNKDGYLYDEAIGEVVGKTEEEAKQWYRDVYEGNKQQAWTRALDLVSKQCVGRMERGIMFIGLESGGSHAISYEVDSSGDVHYIDSQSGKELSIEKIASIMGQAKYTDGTLSGLPAMYMMELSGSDVTDKVTEALKWQ